MRVRVLLGIFMLASVAMSAQKFGATPEDSLTCVQNISLGNERYGQKAYADAAKFYLTAIGVCPKAQKTPYVNSAKSYKKLISATKGNPELKDKLVDTLMMVYDLRIENFGQRGYVLEKKASDHLKYRKKEPETAFAMFEEAYALRGNKMGAGAIVYMYKSRYDMYKQGKCEKVEVIELYPVLKAIADNGIKNGKNEKTKSNYSTSANNLLQIFKEVASCEDLVSSFQPRFETQKDDLEAVRGILELLNAKECEETDFYIVVAKRLQELEPSPLAAWSIANWYVKKQNCGQAIDYYLEAFALADSMDEAEKNPFKVKASTRAAYCYLSNGQYAKVKLMAKKALSIDPNNGEAYMLLGDAYTGGANSFGEDACAKRAGHWAAADKYSIAIAKDPMLKAKASAKLSKAKGRFPSKSECFFIGVKEGDAYTVGGWINETTTARFSE
ncbi:MAG: tetratricopeptide repeat protein [Salibacteraceae bacterium]